MYNSNRSAVNPPAPADPPHLLPFHVIESFLPTPEPHQVALQVAVSPVYSSVHQLLLSPTDIIRLDSDHQAETLATFAEYAEEIKSISKGDSIRSARNIKLLKFVQRTYFPCPNHGQFVEGAVKDTALAGQTGAEERRRNNVAIIRSHTVEETNKLARRKQVHKIDGTSDQVPSGSKLTSSFLDVVEEQFNRDIPEEKIKIARRLLSRTSQYKEERQTKKVDAIVSAKRKRPNVAQLKRGVDYTASARGLITYGSIYRSNYMLRVQTELHVRGVEIPDDADGIKKLLAVLKADEKERHNFDAKAFKPLSNFVIDV